MSAAVELGEGGRGGVHGGMKLTGMCVSWEMDETPLDVVGVRAAAIEIFRGAPLHCDIRADGAGHVWMG